MRRAALALAVLAALLLGACGIPDKTDVRVLGNGPSAGPARDSDSAPPDPVSRTQTTDVVTFVDNYLQAAAGDPETALNRVTAFMTPAAKKAFRRSSPGVMVVRPTADPLNNPGESEVTVDAQEVGVLGDDGELVLSPASSDTALHFQVQNQDNTLYITDAPPVLLLSEIGLKTYYQQHTIYFWNNDNTGLVPDVRYMPLSVPMVQQPTVILKWLTGGPADWLQATAQRLPQGMTAPDIVPAISDDRLQISLTTSAGTPTDAADLDRLRRQLLWSLGRGLAPNSLELRIGHNNPVTYTGSEWLGSNAAYGLRDQPDRFVVYNGKIRRLSSESSHSVDAVPVLKPAANAGIQAAALSDAGQHAFAAVVTGTGASTALRVAVAPVGKEADLRAVRGLRAPLGYPAWAITSTGDTDTAVGLIISQNRLYSFTADARAAAQPVEWPGGDPGPITAFSVAPDGSRIALVAGGKLYRAVLTTPSDGVVLSTPEQLLPAGLRSMSAVAWSSEGWLVVAGVKTATKRVALVNVSIDAALSTDLLSDIGTDTVTYLTAYPINPVTRTQINEAQVAYVARGDAWSAPGYPSRITAAELAGPANSPSGVTVSPTAPFFLN